MALKITKEVLGTVNGEVGSRGPRRKSENQNRGGHLKDI